ncbi:hypothetical protein Dimus_014256 [Dionaea muscipula]
MTMAASQVIDDNIASSLELAPSLIEQLGEAFLQLKALDNTSGAEIQWNEVKEYFLQLEYTLKKRFEDLEVKEKDIVEKESETRRVLAEKEAAVAAKEQDLLDRVQVLKDAAVAAVLEARSIHVPEPTEPSSDNENSNEYKVSSSLDDENAPPDAQEKYSPYLGENTGEINPRPELVQLCEQMDAKGLLKFTMENQKNLSGIRKELSVALTSAREPARLVLDSLEGFFPSDEITQPGENGENGDVTPQGDEGDAALKGLRRSCLIFLEAMATLLAKVDPDVDNLLSPETKQQAKAIADEWKLNLPGEGIDAANRSLLEVEAFLRLLATFRIASEFVDGELCELVLAVAHLRQAPELCRSLGLTHQIIQVIVQTLINAGRQVDAVHFIQAFELTENYPPVPLLKTYLKDLRRNSQGGSSSQVDCNALELAALKAVIGCVKEYKLEADYPLEPLQKRKSQLGKAKGGEKRTAEAGRYYLPIRKQRAIEGFHGHRSRGGGGGGRGRGMGGGGGRGGGAGGGGRQPPAFFGMQERYPYAAAAAPNTYTYPHHPPPNQAGYPPQGADQIQRSYYYPQDDRAAGGPHSAAARPSYAAYLAGAAQPAHQPYM